MIQQELVELQIHAERAARLAGAILADGFGKPLETRSKVGMHNLVTQSDLQAEQAIVTSLRAVTPNATIMAEESGLDYGSDSLMWVIDPLDGTVNFAHGIPMFCVSIAAVQHGQIIVGVIYNPLLDEMFSATLGGGATRNGQPISVTQTTSLHESILVTGFPYNVAENPLGCIEQFSNIIRRGLPVRRLGSAALDLAYIAAGRFDGFWEAVLQPWDMAAGVRIVEEAGGRVTHYGNQPFTLSMNSIIATNGHIHPELSQALEL